MSDVGFSTGEFRARQNEYAPSGPTLLRPGTWVKFPAFFIPCSMTERLSGAIAAEEVDNESEGG